MARTGLFRREHKHAADSPVDIPADVPAGSPAETRAYPAGGPAPIGHDATVDHPAGDTLGHPQHADAGRHTHAGDRRRAELRDVYGGFNWGACFFGWLVAVGVTVLLGAIVSAVASAVGADQRWTWADLEAMADSVGIAAAITLAVVMFLGYYAGGYVAARMSRFDAVRQGLGVWVVAVVVMIIAAVAGALFGTRYDFLRQLDLPQMGLSNDQLGWGALITGLALLAVMLVGALLGAAAGRRYHAKIDRAAYDI